MALPHRTDSIPNGHDAMASLDPEVFDVDPARLRHPQPERPEQAGQGVVDGATGSALDDERSEFHPIEAEGGRFGVDLGPATELRRRVLDEAVDHREAGEAGHRGQPSGHGRGGPPVRFLARAHNSR
jgi:hypothetical protein